MKLPIHLLERFNVVLGVWLFFSPLVFGLYIPGAITLVVAHSFFMGAVLVVISLAAYYHEHLWEDVIDMMIGFWLIMSPFVLAFSGEVLVTLNHVIIGVLLMMDAIISIMRTPKTRRAH